MRKSVHLVGYSHTYIIPTLYAQPDPTYTVQAQVGQNLFLLSKTLFFYNTAKNVCFFFCGSESFRR